LIHVPLLIAYPPSVPAARSVAETVSNADLAATVLDLVGLADAATVPGSSLRRFWREGAAAPSSVIAAEANPGEAKRSVVVGRHHYIRNPKAPAQLFDVVADPSEQHDLAGQIEHRQLLEKLSAALDSVLASRGAVRASSGPDTSGDP